MLREDEAHFPALLITQHTSTHWMRLNWVITVSQASSSQ